ncbi:MAG: ATP-binding protein [Kofleriaceae bacterium]
MTDLLAMTGTPIPRRLQLACTLVDAVLDDNSTFLDELAFPAAVFGSSSIPDDTNAAWRARFGVGPCPDALHARVRATLATGIEHHDAELVVPTIYPTYLAVTLHRRRSGDAVIAACADITDATLLDRLGCGADALVWSGPRRGTADYFSRAWCNYTRGEDSTTRTWQYSIDPGDVERSTYAFGEAARRRSSSPIEVRIRRSDGLVRWHLLRFTTIGEDPRWYGIATDIDDARNRWSEENLAYERAARADAEHANAMKDQFLAAVSHELRSPITTMLLWERILRDPSSSAALHATAIDAIHQSAETQARLVGDLLDVSRAISGKLHIDATAVDLDGVLDAAIASIMPIAVAKRIVIERHPGAPVGPVLGDRTRVRQILDNLLSNAVKFTASPGHVLVAATRETDVVAIDIADSGRGIAPEFLPKLFEPFSQSDDVLTRHAGGLGLGLAISRQLATLHQGTLTARSLGADRGATFTLTLPCTQRPAVVQVPSASHALTRIRVLVVDDDPRVRDALAVLLDRAGAVVITADSAATARVRIADEAPHALVCDLAMPDEDGYSLLRELRAAGSTIPAIALTAHASLADVQRSRAAGFEVHLAKPVDIAELVENIDQLVHAIA